MNRCTIAAIALILAGAASCKVAPAPAPTVSPAAATPLPPVSRPSTVRDELARLAVDDRPYTGPAYRREDWPHWKDPDGNGCDARKDALRAQSTPPVTTKGCSTTGGRWPLVYVPGETTNPSDVDADHIVPLGNAGHSGGGSWSTELRTTYANDPTVLWIVEDNANQAKGDKSPDQWRPAVHAVWCDYARRWTEIKVRYHLTATTAERDALGQMLDTC